MLMVKLLAFITVFFVQVAEATEESPIPGCSYRPFMPTELDARTVTAFLVPRDSASWILGAIKSQTLQQSNG